MDGFPTPEDLWQRYRAWKGLESEAVRVVLENYHEDGIGKTPRYYQFNAINATIEAIAKGHDRILPGMVTGTGKPILHHKRRRKRSMIFSRQWGVAQE